MSSSAWLVDSKQVARTILNIAITADPELPIPPRLYGGIERIVEMLVNGLTARGHNVTLFAHRDSSAKCYSLRAYKGTNSRSRIDTLRNMATVWGTVRTNDIDIVHSFGRLAYIAPLLPSRVPKLMTYQREISPFSVGMGHKLSRGTLHFSAVSRHMMQAVEHLANWHLIYNGVPLSTYQFSQSVSDDAPLVFLGRIEPIKGTHLAVQIAHQAGRKLVIAGNLAPLHQAYFDAEILPHLDGDQIRYVGPVDDVQKNTLLGGAAALLMPILWEEPFGIVMAEALACGTPVLGLGRGSVPEVVEDGVSGFVRETSTELADAVSHLPMLSRDACRARAEVLFSEDVVVEGYLTAYRHIISG